MLYFDKTFLDASSVHLCTLRMCLGRWVTSDLQANKGQGTFLLSFFSFVSFDWFPFLSSDFGLTIFDCVSMPFFRFSELPTSALLLSLSLSSELDSDGLKLSSLSLV